jgi:ubiquinone/menaquinone biosynthesis C-methylase UbiE
MQENNLKTYERPSIVESYVKAAGLFESEKAVIDLLAARLSHMDMLDIGVGGGRTTDSYAPAVKSYVGVDYANAMVDACIAKYQGRWPFFCCDARDLSMFADDSFDLVLFSFNGIDTVSPVDRLKVLSEIWRVCRPGGVFSFSSHNLELADRFFRWKSTGGLARLPRDLARHIIMHLVNLRYVLLKPTRYVLLNDGVYRFSLRTYYGAPSYQIEQLQRSGFTNVRVFAESTGEELKGPAYPDAHPTYLCDVAGK